MEHPVHIGTNKCKSATGTAKVPKTKGKRYEKMQTDLNKADKNVGALQTRKQNKKGLR